MTKIRYVNFYADEWLVGTIGLDVADIGVYIQACALIYSRGGPVEKADLQRVVRCHWRTFEACLKRLVEAGKLTHEGSMIGSKRCSRELQDSLKRVSSAVQNGLKGGRPPNKINELDKPTGSYARAKGNQDKKKEESKILLGEGLGRCAPSEGVAAAVPEPVSPAPVAAAVPAQPRAAPPPAPAADSEAPPITPEDRAYMAAELDKLMTQLTGKPPAPKFVRDPVAYERAACDGKWNGWLNALHGFVSQRFDGDQRWQAWEAIDCARTAGSRQATPPETRKLLDDFDLLKRAEARVAA